MSVELHGAASGGSTHRTMVFERIVSGFSAFSR